MKPYHITAIAGMLSLCLGACDSDIEPVYVNPADGIELGGASDPIILRADRPEALAMTLYWSGDGRLALSDPQLQAPVDAAVETIQLSADADFTSPLDISVEKGVRQHQFLTDELNALLGRLDFPAEQATPLYIRIRSVLAANMPVTYSDVLRVSVQTYRIHLDLATVLDKDRNETAMRLYSPGEDGIYSGFMGVNGWTNWWLREANNVLWGNLGEDGKTFYASSDDSHWNFWFPDPAGCYYTTVNTVEGWWSALHIDNITVGGDLSGEMIFNIKANQWTLDVSQAAAGTVNITLGGKGSLYDRTTTDMGPAVERTIGFGGSADALTFGDNATTIAVTLPAGETTLVLDLSDPRNLTVAAGEAAPEPETNRYLYFSGVTDWAGFDVFLTLYDESTRSYGGAHYINSEWGYRAYPEPDWGTAYKGADDATALSGSLVLAESGNDGNIPAPAAGVYVMDFNMSALTYRLTEVQRVSFTGLNDDWSEHDMTRSADNPEVYTAEFVKEKETPWGVKVLINGDWGLFFGGGDGVLRLGHSDATTGFDGDNALTVGETYILTVDLGKQTYTYSLK